MKRAFDLFGATIGLLGLSPLLATVAVLVKLTSPGPILFRQERVGRRFKPFWIYKFRTMVRDAPLRGGLVTVDGDRRITRVGKILRKTKIDELPQLFNVLKGEMSLVGPRPEVRKYVEMFRADYEAILDVRPGLTDPASLKYRHEEAILARSTNPEEEYVCRVLPDKIRVTKEYLKKASVGEDLALIFKTAARLAGFQVSV
jgi:lipopolysaccharide/colanic/teichoic acid biosynthesis glycosyltransferase